MFAHELRLDTLMHYQKRSLTTQLNRHCSCMIQLMRATPSSSATVANPQIRLVRSRGLVDQLSQ